MLEDILAILPLSLKMIVANLPNAVQAGLEEIRVRERRPLEINHNGKYAFVTDQAELASDEVRAYRPNREDCRALLELLTNHSIYTFEEELKRGFITIAGGHRVGLAGRTVLDSGQVKQIRDIGSFNIRIARDIQGAGRLILPYLQDRETESIHHTLVISPPQQGKTTLIRDLARCISRGDWGNAGLGIGGLKVGIVDERSELAACEKGVPRFDLGPRTDVMDGCPKAEGMMMMIRSLSPEVLVVDEIGRPEDAAAIHEALHAGIKVLATAHGAQPEDIRQRPVLKTLMAEGVFTRIVVLGRRRDGEAPFQVFDRRGNPLKPSITYRIGRG
jgi:stage III sporulation protein AA